MGVPIFSGNRVLVSTTTTGSANYILGPALDGFHTPAQAGLISGRRYSYIATSSVGTGGAPAQWERGYGTLTNSGGTWNLSRVVRRNKDGGNSAVNWLSGPKFVAIIADAEDLVTFDSDGWLGIGGDPDRSRAAPLDVITSGGPLATFRALVNSTLQDVLSVSKDAITAHKPVLLPDGSGLVPGKTKSAKATFDGAYGLTQSALTIDATRIPIPAGTQKVRFDVAAYFSTTTSAADTTCFAVPQILNAQGVQGWSSDEGSIPILSPGGAAHYRQLTVTDVFDNGGSMAEGFVAAVAVYRGANGAASLYRLRNFVTFLGA